MGLSEASLYAEKEMGNHIEKFSTEKGHNLDYVFPKAALMAGQRMDHRDHSGDPQDGPSIPLCKYIQPAPHIHRLCTYGFMTSEVTLLQGGGGPFCVRDLSICRFWNGEGVLEPVPPVDTQGLTAFTLSVVPSHHEVG